MKNKFLSNPSSTIKLQQRVQFVHDYLIDQHPLTNENVKRQLFNDNKLTKKRKISMSNSIPITTITNNESCIDLVEKKISTLILLLHDCS